LVKVLAVPVGTLELMSAKLFKVATQSWSALVVVAEVDELI
jgi:hypothetical protein